MKKIARRVGGIRKSKFGALFEPTSPMSALTAVHRGKTREKFLPGSSCNSCSGAKFSRIRRIDLSFSHSFQSITKNLGEIANGIM
jgi:hypothetical protein